MFHPVLVEDTLWALRCVSFRESGVCSVQNKMQSAANWHTEQTEKRSANQRNVYFTPG
jgi:hypothetical protein